MQDSWSITFAQRTGGLGGDAVGGDCGSAMDARLSQTCEN
jgi:hypothetical protein